MANQARVARRASITAAPTAVCGSMHRILVSDSLLKDSPQRYLPRVLIIAVLSEAAAVGAVGLLEFPPAAGAAVAWAPTEATVDLAGAGAVPDVGLTLTPAP